MAGQVVHGLLKRIKPIAESASQDEFLSPAFGVAFVELFQIEQVADDACGNLELGGEADQVLVKLSSEGQELFPALSQQSGDGIKLLGAKRAPALAIGRG